MSIILALLSIIFGIITIILLIITFALKINQRKKKGKKVHKRSIISFVSSLFTGAITVATSFNVSIRHPEIFPTGNISGIDPVQVTISPETSLVKTYYTLDGSDPKGGDIYENSIIITGSTTVTARNNFFIWWSEIVVHDYTFEKLSFNDETAGELYTSAPEVSKTHNSEQEQPNLQANTAETELSSQSQTIDGGLNETEGYELMTYINQYRIGNGIDELAWNSDLEQMAKGFAVTGATGGKLVWSSGTYVIGRQCNGAQNAEQAVSDWTTGNAYIPSEAENLLNTEYTQMGGALYYLPSGNEFGYHYFWIICLK